MSAADSRFAGRELSETIPAAIAELYGNFYDHRRVAFSSAKQTASGVGCELFLLDAAPLRVAGGTG